MNPSLIKKISESIFTVSNGGREKEKREWYDTNDKHASSKQFSGSLSCLTTFSSSIDLLSQPNHVIDTHHFMSAVFFSLLFLVPFILQLVIGFWGLIAEIFNQFVNKYNLIYYIYCVSQANVCAFWDQKLYNYKFTEMLVI